jgi:peptidoglycan/LPS O-acetylase OafA/YrhL
MALAQTVERVVPTTIAGHPYRVLGGYRLLLATLVLLSHTFNMVVGEISKVALGNVGVMLFFVVSGFVIFEALDLFYRDRTPQFLVNRAFKIFPAFWAATLLMYVLHSIFDVAHLDGVPPLQLSAWGIFVNITLLPAYLKWGNNLLVISVAWAVLVECQFYITAAVLVALARRLPASSAVLAAVM